MSCFLGLPGVLGHRVCGVLGLECFDHRSLGIGLMFHLVRLWLVRFHVVVDMIGAFESVS